MHFEGDHAQIDVNQFACPAANRALSGAERRLAIESALAKAANIAQPPPLVHLNEHLVAEVAVFAGISPSVLHRSIEQHCAMFRIAA